MFGKSRSKSWVAIIISMALLLALVIGCSAPAASTPTKAPTSGQTTATQASTSASPAANTPATGQSSATITLKVADMFPATHNLYVGGIKPWMDRVTALTNGKVKFESYPAEQLGKVADHLTLLTTGAADIAYLPPITLSSDFPLHGVTGLPIIAKDAETGTKAYAAVAKEGPLREEFTKKGVQPLFYYFIPNMEVLTAKKQVTKMEDLQGLKLRVTAAQVPIATALGAVPVQISVTDMYQAIQRGTVDGAFMTFSGMTSYKLDEVCKYATVGAQISSGIVGYGMTEAGWNKLPKDVQDAMIKASEEISVSVAQLQDKQGTEAIAKGKTAGMQITELSKDEISRWKTAFTPVTDDWVKKMDAQGLPGQTVLDSIRKAAGN